MLFLNMTVSKHSPDCRCSTYVLDGRCSVSKMYIKLLVATLHRAIFGSWINANGILSGQAYKHY